MINRSDFVAVNRCRILEISWTSRLGNEDVINDSHPKDKDHFKSSSFPREHVTATKGESVNNLMGKERSELPYFMSEGTVYN